MQVSAGNQTVQRERRDDRGFGFNPENFENARQQIRVDGRQERGQSRVGEGAAEAVAGDDGAGDPSEGPMLEHERIHPVVVEKGNDGEADGEGDERHQDVRLNGSRRRFCGHEWRNSRRSATSG